jgi:hypothetical protein
MPPESGSDELKDLGPFEAVAKIASMFDFEATPTSKLGWFVRISGTLAGIVVIVNTVLATAGVLLETKPPTPLPSQEFPGDKFRLSEERRKEIFEELATAELAERKRAINQNTWQGQLWSREDDRGWYEAKAVREAAQRHGLSESQVYLVLDEGIRNHWLAPNGEPLPGTTPPLHPRTTW